MMICLNLKHFGFMKIPKDLMHINYACFRYKFDFLRRLVRLNKTLTRFFYTGRPCNLFPDLFAVLIVLWSDSKVLRKVDIPPFPYPADLVSSGNNGRNECAREPVRSSASESVEDSGSCPVIEEVPDSPAYGMY